MPDLKELTKRYEKMSGILKSLDKAAADESEQIKLIESALNGIAGLESDALKQQLQTLQTSAKEKQERALGSRRQELETAARSAGLQYRRLANSDKVGVFGVEYAGRKVKVLVGSELLTSFEETSGTKVVARIAAEVQRLDKLLLPREKFLRVMKTAASMARVEGLQTNGRTKIRDLFPYVAVARQLSSDAFRKKPQAKSYVEYGLAELAYELHRFGDHAEGWTCNGQRLCNTGPAMSSQHEALVLPDAHGNPTQVLWVWIE